MPHFTATVTVSAEHRGRETEAVDNPAIAVELRTLEPGVMELVFQGQLDAPDEPTHVCVSLDNGLNYYGPITGGSADEKGGGSASNATWSSRSCWSDRFTPVGASLLANGVCRWLRRLRSTPFPLPNPRLRGPP